MNNFLKWGLTLQVPNVVLVSILLTSFIMTNANSIISVFTLNANTWFWIIIGTILGLTNVFSIVFIVAGLITKEAKSNGRN